MHSPDQSHPRLSATRRAAKYLGRITETILIGAGRLLVFDVAEGWAPLCGFLDCLVPDGDFSRSNSVEEFWQVFGGGEEPT